MERGLSSARRAMGGRVDWLRLVKIACRTPGPPLHPIPLSPFPREWLRFASFEYLQTSNLKLETGAHAEPAPRAQWFRFVILSLHAGHLSPFLGSWLCFAKYFQ